MKKIFIYVCLFALPLLSVNSYATQTDALGHAAFELREVLKQPGLSVSSALVIQQAINEVEAQMGFVYNCQNHGSNNSSKICSIALGSTSKVLVDGNPAFSTGWSWTYACNEMFKFRDSGTCAITPESQKICDDAISAGH